MTDKVQKIKEYLVGMAGAACCDAKTKKVIKANILPFIDSLQEEPVNYNKLNTMLNDALSKETKESWNEKLGEEPVSKVWHDASEEPEEGKDFAFVTYDGIMWARYRIEDIFLGWQRYRIQTELDKWAYVSDLLKL